eukprot:jgi/Ulvmu1/9550/UM053_0039.1
MLTVVNHDNKVQGLDPCGESGSYNTGCSLACVHARSTEADRPEHCCYSLPRHMAPWIGSQGTRAHGAHRAWPPVRAVTRLVALLYGALAAATAAASGMATQPGELGSENRPSVCGLPRMPGVCVSEPLPWYFDDFLHICRHYRHGGCNHNDNHFKSREDCEATCDGPGAKVCGVPIAHGIACAGGSAPGTYYAFSADLGKCVTFLFKGCGGNSNRFDTMRGCVYVCSYKSEEAAREAGVGAPLAAESIGALGQ